MLVLVLRFAQNRLIVIAEHMAPLNISTITLLSFGSIKRLCRQRGYRGHFLFKLLILPFYITAFLSCEVYASTLPILQVPLIYLYFLSVLAIMQLLSVLSLCLLVSGGSAQLYVDSRSSTSNTTSLRQNYEYILRYEYRMVPLTADFTVLDDFNHDILTIGNNSNGEIIEVKPNDGRSQWHMTRLASYTHVVRDKYSNKYIHFPTLKDGAIATLSSDAATLFEAVIGPNVIYNLNATDANPRDGPLFWTVEPLSATDQRPVLKLRKPAFGRARQDFVMKKTPQQGNN